MLMSLYMVEPRRIELLSEIFTYPKHFYAIDVVSVLPLQAGTCDTVKSFPGCTESVHLHHLVFFFTEAQGKTVIHRMILLPQTFTHIRLVRRFGNPAVSLRRQPFQPSMRQMQGGSLQ